MSRYRKEIGIVSVVLILCGMLLLLCGCSTTGDIRTESRRDLHQFTKTVVEVLSTSADGVVSVVPLTTVTETWTDEKTKTATVSETKLAPDMQKISEGVRVVSQAAVGSLTTGTGPLALVTTLLVAAAGVAMKNGGSLKAVKDALTKSEADNTEGWQKAEDNQRRAEGYARQLPPDQAKA